MLLKCYTILRWWTMDKEIINFGKAGLFIRSSDISMNKDGIYRDMHLHSAIEIVEVKNGYIKCFIGDEIVVAKEGDIVFINSNVVHKLRADNAEITYTNVDIGFYEKNNFSKNYVLLYDFISSLKAKPYYVFSNNDQLLQILNKISSKYYESDENSWWYLKAYIYELIAFMHEHEFILPFATITEQIKKIEPIVLYIDSNYKSTITLEEICGAVKYNKYTVCHNFKDVTGSTVFEYINYLRIRQAINLLREKNITVMEVSSECGFSTVTYFNRVFKNTMGCTPTTYRKYINI